MQDEGNNSALWNSRTTYLQPPTIAPTMVPRLLTEREVAEILGLSVKTLRNWRVAGGPLPHVKISRAVRYQQDDVARLIARQRRWSTSDSGGGP
jgi:predicted DNA-binding transcriptional regulator AlpA